MCCCWVLLTRHIETPQHALSAESKEPGPWRIRHIHAFNVVDFELRKRSHRLIGSLVIDPPLL